MLEFSNGIACRPPSQIFPLQMLEKSICSITGLANTNPTMYASVRDFSKHPMCNMRLVIRTLVCK